LRRLRRDAGYTQEALARVAGYSRVYVTLIENGHNSPGHEFVRFVGNVLDARPRLETLHAEIMRAGAASRAQVGTLQAPELVVHDLDIIDGDIDNGIVLKALSPDGEPVVVNISRRSALKKLGTAAAFGSLATALATDSPSRHSTSTSTTPLEHLQLMYHSLIESDNLFGSAYTLQATHDQLRVVEQLCTDARGTDRRDLLLLRARFAESMAWLTQDQADHDTAWRWTDRALEWSHLAGDAFLTAIVLVRKSQLAADAGNGAAALDYANAVADVALPNTRLPAVSALCAAHSHALLGERAQSQRSYDVARAEISATELDPSLSWGSWLDHAYVDAQEARSLAAVGRHAESVVGFDRAINALPEGYPRDRGVYLARAARANSSADEPEEAARLGVEALEVGMRMKSGRIEHELRSLLRQLDGVESDPVVEFRERARVAELV